MNRSKEINFIIGSAIFAFTGLSIYWIVWFTMPQLVQLQIPNASDHLVYINFEQAFPLADSYIIISLIIGTIGLLQMKSWGFLATMLGCGAVIFLGLMDLLYFLEHNTVFPLDAQKCVELLIIITVLSLDPFIIKLLWKNRKEFM